MTYEELVKKAIEQQNSLLISSPEEAYVRFGKRKLDALGTEEAFEQISQKYPTYLQSVTNADQFLSWKDDKKTKELESKKAFDPQKEVNEAHNPTQADENMLQVWQGTYDPKDTPHAHLWKDPEWRGQNIERGWDAGRGAAKQGLYYTIPSIWGLGTMMWDQTLQAYTDPDKIARVQGGSGAKLGNWSVKDDWINQPEQEELHNFLADYGYTIYGSASLGRNDVVPAGYCIKGAWDAAMTSSLARRKDPVGWIRGKDSKEIMAGKEVFNRAGESGFRPPSDLMFLPELYPEQQSEEFKKEFQAKYGKSFEEYIDPHINVFESKYESDNPQRAPRGVDKHRSNQLDPMAYLMNMYDSIDGNLRGGVSNVQIEIPELYIEHIDLVEGLDKQKYYLDAYGRTNESGVMLENPIDIIRDLVVNEIGHDKINEAEYVQAHAQHDGWKFAFTIHEKMNSKQIIEEIAKSTKCFPKFKSDGSFSFNTLKDSYDESDYNSAHPIKESEIISYNFKKTKPEQIYKKIDLKYSKDYGADEYLESITTIDESPDLYYGIEDGDDAHLEFESEFIRDSETADKLGKFLSSQYKNDHLLFDMKLPLQYIDIELGSLIKFTDLFQNVKAYGIDYRKIENPNGQFYYPLFMVTGINKNLDSISVSCMQLHHLADTNPNEFWDENNEFDFADTTSYEEEVPTGIYVENLYLSQESSFVEDGETIYPDNLFLALEGFVFITPEFDTTNSVANFSEMILNDEEFFQAGKVIKVARLQQEDEFYANFYIETAYKYHLVVRLLDFSGDPYVWLAQDVFDELVITSVDISEAIKVGDVNLDSQVNILDVVRIVNHILQTNPLDELGQIAADTNEDGFLNILDVVTLANMIMEDS